MVITIRGKSVAKSHKVCEGLFTILCSKMGKTNDTSQNKVLFTQLTGYVEWQNKYQICIPKKIIETILLLFFIMQLYFSVFFCFRNILLILCGKKCLESSVSILPCNCLKCFIFLWFSAIYNCFSMQVFSFITVFESCPNLIATTSSQPYTKRFFAFLMFPYLSWFRSWGWCWGYGYICGRGYQWGV